MSNSGEFQKYQSPLDVEKYPEGLQGLELEQVHIYVRHGERAPVGVRMTDQPANIPEHWIMCKTARRMQASVYGLPESGDEFLQSRKIVERKDGTSMEGQCLLGELTDLGRKSTYDYGTSLRKLYIDRLGFLPDTLEKPDQVYFRTTNMPRTTESLQQIIHGLYPTSKCHADATPPILVRNGRDENLIGNTSNCKRLEILLVGFAQAAASAFNPTLEPLDKKLSKYLGGNAIRVDGKPRASGIMDTIRAAIAHNIKVPPEFEDKSVIDTIERAVVSEWFSDKTEEVRRLGMGRLLDDLSRKMQHKVENGERDPLKILVHATHDTGLAALCSTLDVFDDKWPAFTASITFELFKKTADLQSSSIMHTMMSPFRTMSRPEYFVRMRYQNKNMALPMCADEGKHLPGSPEFCTLAAFRERIKELTPVDWDAECAPGGRGSQ
ncbi:acid phosphatase [Moniliophthora roreri MCA 2997]|uniref:Acid phosphatase n=1 Tax=Moniliophthora roreri (strain MCA 2997) TaxID=1381753 RepID=V2XRB1_MONRO|nr:acid phosphatase [Moniliophthora roreri MCA 2997]